MTRKNTNGAGIFSCRVRPYGSARFELVLPILLALLTCVVRDATANDVGLSVSANRNQLYLGESFLLTVRVSGLKDPPEPDFGTLEGFKIDSLGSRGESRTSIEFRNGRLIKNSFHGRTFTYRLTPTRTGTLQAGPVRLRADGQTLSQPGPTVAVQGIEEQDLVLVSIEGSRESVLVDEAFDITLSIAIRRLDGRYSDTHPLDPGSPPLLRVPYLDGKPIEGLETPTIQRILRERLVSGRNDSGFAINDYTVRADPFDVRGMFDFDSMFDERKAKFIFPRVPFEHDGKAYWRYTLTLTYTPKEEGSYTFGPAVFKGSVIERIDEGRRAVPHRIFAVGPAYTVRVVPPPEEGRPETYVGAIGSALDIQARLDTRTCTVGDPLTLHLTLSGDISLDNIRAPALGVQTNLWRDFRVYEDTVRTDRQANSKTYSYTIRPIRAGTLELPPIDVAFFDVNTRTYKTVQSQPIPVRANEAPDLGDDMIIADTARSEQDASDRKSAGGAPAPVWPSPRGARPQNLLGMPVSLILGLIGPAVALGVLLVRFLARQWHTMSETGRRHTACRRTVRMLNHLAGNESGDAGQCVDLLRTYLSERSGQAMPAGLTPADIARHLRRYAPSASQSVDELGTLLEQLYEESYRGDRNTGAESGQLQRLAALLRDIDGHWQDPLSRYDGDNRA